MQQRQRRQLTAEFCRLAFVWLRVKGLFGVEEGAAEESIYLFTATGRWILKKAAVTGTLEQHDN